jgi:hypothetical protein
MKKYFFFFLFSLFLISGISAIEIDMNSEFSQGETLIAKVSGNFVNSLQKENILFYKEHERVSFEYSLIKIDYDYYLYALLSDKPEGNYSVSLENIKYALGGVILDDDVKKNFSITEEKADFFITPGVIDSSKSFSITIQNLKDSSLDVDVSTSNFSSAFYISDYGTKELSLILRAGESKKIDFVLGEVTTSFNNIIFSSENTNYDVPTRISNTASEGETIFPIEEQNKGVKFFNSNVSLFIPTNSLHVEKIILSNVGDSEIQKVSLSLSDELAYYSVLSNDEIKNLKPNSNESFELSFFSEENAEVEGYVYADFEEEQISLFVSLSFLTNPSDAKTPATKTCAEFEGVICDTETKKCEGKLEPASDGWCCVGTCSEIKKSNTGRIIAVILILFLIGGITWFYFKKYKKSKKPVDLLKVAKGKH